MSLRSLKFNNILGVFLKAFHISQRAAPASTDLFSIISKLTGLLELRMRSLIFRLHDFLLFKLA